MIRYTLIGANLINRLIISSISIKRSRNISYELKVSNSFTTNYKSKSNSNLFFIIINLIKLVSNSRISNYKDTRSKKKYKSNSKTITYYYRYLDYSRNVIQLKEYNINLSKKINNKVSYALYIIKKIT